MTPCLRKDSRANGRKRRKKIKLKKKINDKEKTACYLLIKREREREREKNKQTTKISSSVKKLKNKVTKSNQKLCLSIYQIGKFLKKRSFLVLLRKRNRNANTIGGNINWYNLCGDNLAVFIKCKSTFFDPAVFLLKNLSYRNTSTHAQICICKIFTFSLHLNLKSWKQPKYLLTEE